MTDQKQYLIITVLLVVALMTILYDFALFLMLSTLITGAIWLIDVLFFKAAREASAAQMQAAEGESAADADSATTSIEEPLLLEYSKSFFPILLIVFVLRSFIVEPFRIPSGSMLPTLEVGDFILVNKFSYGLRWPVSNTKLIALGEPERGDVVVFEYPENRRIDYIKRIVALPGDKLSYQNKQLFINGVKAEQTVLAPYIYHGDNGRQIRSQDINEDLAGVQHRILTTSLAPPRNLDTVVPPGHYFVMGDNRDNSADSRFWGFLPEENLVGKAFFIWMHFDTRDLSLDLSRVGESIK